MKKIGILTGGGDAPGLNGIIEACARGLIGQGHRLFGIHDGFEGIFSGQISELTLDSVMGLHSRAGTVIGTSNKSGTRGRESEFLQKFSELKLDGLIVAGGDGTFQGMRPFEKQIKVIGVPKTIDNDLSGTDLTFGFDTACSVVAEALDSLRATAEAHHRVIVVETMGRTAGWIALGGGLAGYADAILIPEKPFVRDALKRFLVTEKARGRRGLVIAVSEGAFAQGESPKVAFVVKGSPQQERYGGVSYDLSRWIESVSEWESRHVVLGHLQRAKHPTTTDRFLTLSMGVEVVKMVEEEAWGKAVVYRHGKLERAPVSDLMQPPRLVSLTHPWVEMAATVGVFI